MKKEIKILSRAQTAKIHQNLANTFYNIKSRKINTKNNIQIKRPLTTYHDTKLSQLYLPPTELVNEHDQNLLKENEEYQKHHLNEVNIHNLFTEKLWEKNNMEKNEDYTKKIAYKKLIMRAKLLKAMKTNIVLRKKDFDEFNNKYYKGNKLLSEKIKKKKRKDSDDISLSDNDNNNIKEKPNFNTIKNPDIFSQYEYTSLFQDFFCSPIELIEKIFNYDEQKIIKLDPIFFRLNRYPFTGVQKNFGFSLKDKINEEDNFVLEKIKKIQELNKKFFDVKRKQKRRKTEVEKNEIQKEAEEKNNNKNINNKNINNNRIKSAKPLQDFFPNNDNKNSNKNEFKNYFNNLFPKSSKKRKKLKLDLTEEKKSQKKEKKFNLNTDYNVYLEIKKNKNKNKKFKRYQTANYMYSDEEKIKDKKKRLTMEELLEIYNERKKLYLEDLSYNRKKNKYKFEQLRIKKHEENLKENHKKENLRKILVNIEENYKLFQK